MTRQKARDAEIFKIPQKEGDRQVGFGQSISKY